MSSSSSNFLLANPLFLFDDEGVETQTSIEQVFFFLILILYKLNNSIY